MITCIKTDKGNRFDILDNRRKSIQQITCLNYAELEKLYWEIGIELVAEHDIAKEKFYGKSIPEIFKNVANEIDKKSNKIWSKKCKN